MSNRTPHTVMAFYQGQQRFYAVEVCRRGQRYELLKARSVPLAEMTWTAFAEDCGLRLSDGDTGRGHAVVVGMSSVGVMSFRLDLPPVSESQLADMVRLQSESRLPLPLEQMELGWRRVGTGTPPTGVSVVAARRQRITNLMNQIKPLRAQTVLLDSEALATLAMRLGSDCPTDGVIVNLDHHVTHVCRLEGGQLSQSLILDLGRSDLFDLDQQLLPQAVEPLVQDLRRAVQVLCGETNKNERVVLLSDGGRGDAALGAAVGRMGFLLQVCPLQWDCLRQKETQESATPWDYRLPLGLALWALEGAKSHSLFHHLCRRQKTEAKVTKTCSFRRAVVLLVLALIFLGGVTDVAYQVEQQQLEALSENSQVKTRVKQKEYQKALAQYRPDLLDLLKQIHAGEHQGIVLDSLIFERGQAVRLTAHADKPEQMYAFEQELLKQSGIKTVMLDKPMFDKKAKKYNFNISLHYKNFTAKKPSR